MKQMQLSSWIIYYPIARVSEDKSGNRAAYCLLEAIYFLHLECPSNAQDLVPLGSKKCGLSLLICVSMFHLMMFNLCCGEFLQLGQLSEKVWVNSIHLFILRDLVEKKQPSDILKYVLSITRQKVKE